MKTYAASVVREGGWFVIDVPGVGVTQARHQGEIEHMARDLISAVTDVDYAAVNVEVQEVGA